MVRCCLLLHLQGPEAEVIAEELWVARPASAEPSKTQRSGKKQDDADEEALSLKKGMGRTKKPERKSDTGEEADTPARRGLGKPPKAEAAYGSALTPARRGPGRLLAAYGRAVPTTRKRGRPRKFSEDDNDWIPFEEEVDDPDADAIEDDDEGVRRRRGKRPKEEEEEDPPNDPHPSSIEMLGDTLPEQDPRGHEKYVNRYKSGWVALHAAQKVLAEEARQVIINICMSSLISPLPLPIFTTICASLSRFPAPHVFPRLVYLAY